MVRTLLIAMLLAPALINATDAADAADAADSATGALTCAEASRQGPLETALERCRQEHQQHPEAVETLRLLARAEHQSGDATRAVELWRELLGREGWSGELGHELAMSLWRAGRTGDAETQLRDNLSRDPSLQAYEDLISYLMAFSRWQDAVEVARTAANHQPKVCSFPESWGVAEAGLGHDDQAVSLIRTARQLGCPPFRWAWRGLIPQRLDSQPVYHQLLAPDLLMTGLDKLDDDAVLRRLRLLRLTMSNEVTPALVALLEERPEPEISFAALGLLMQVGAEALPAWQQLLASDDFVLRKKTLRRIHELADARFLPMLLQHLEQEQLPGNRSLTKLAAGHLLLQGNQPWRGKELLESIPKDDYLYPVANARLAEWAEKNGRPADAITYLQRAKAADPSFALTETRLQQLRDLAGEATPAASGG